MRITSEIKAKIIYVRPNQMPIIRRRTLGFAVLRYWPIFHAVFQKF